MSAAMSLKQDVIPCFLKGRIMIVHSLEDRMTLSLKLRKPGLLGRDWALLDRSVSSVIADQDSLVVQLPAQHFKKRLLLDPTFLRSYGRATFGWEIAPDQLF